MKKLTANTFSEYIPKIKDENIFLLYGDEPFFFDVFIEKIEKFVFKDVSEKELCYHQFYGSENNVSEILAACLSFPMLAKRKIVLVKEFEKLKISDKESFLKYIYYPQKATVLVLVANKWEKSKFNDKIINGVISVNCKSLSGAELYSWVENKFKNLNITHDKKSIVFLIENIGHNLLRLNHEIEKIVSFVKPANNLTIDTISRLTGFSRDVNIFNFQKVLSTRKLQESLHIGLQLLEQGNSLAAILPMLFIFFRRLWVVKQLSTKKYNRVQISQMLGGSSYIYADIFSSVDNFTFKQIGDIIEKIENAEIELKTSQKPTASILTLLCYYICEKNSS
jgi:DNA polymerase-3 subunit delta